MTKQGTKKYDNPLKATFKGITDLFRKQEKVGELKPGDRLDGKKVLITGSSSGLGLATAKKLAALGAEVIMAVRSGIPEKGDQVRKAAPGATVHMIRVDLSDLNSIQELVSEVKTNHGKVDILICNAAVVAKMARQTKHGLDEMFTVNYVAKFTLVNLMLKADCFNQENGKVPRIIFVSSESHRNPDRFEWETFGRFAPFSIGKTVERYGYFKLLLTTFSQELERRINPNGSPRYSVFALCPGPVNSNIAREAPKIFHPLLKLVFGIFFRSPEKASEPVVYLAASPDLEGKPKDYLFLMGRKSVDEKAADPENGKKLWELSEKLLREKGIEVD